MRRGLAAPDATAQLVQLREAEAVGVLHDHHGGVRHVDTDLDDRRRDQHLHGAGAERGHRLLLLLGLHLAVQQPDAQAAELFGLQALVLGGRGLGLDLALVVHQRAHDVGLVPLVHLGAEVCPRGRVLERARADDGRRDRRAAGRHLPQLGPVQVAVHEHRRGARDRCRGHHEHVGLVALAAQQRTLFHAEAVLLVDDREPET